MVLFIKLTSAVHRQEHSFSTRVNCERMFRCKCRIWKQKISLSMRNPISRPLEDELSWPAICHLTFFGILVLELYISLLVKLTFVNCEHAIPFIFHSIQISIAYRYDGQMFTVHICLAYRIVFFYPTTFVYDQMQHNISKIYHHDKSNRP